MSRIGTVSDQYPPSINGRKTVSEPGHADASDVRKKSAQQLPAPERTEGHRSRVGDANQSAQDKKHLQNPLSASVKRAAEYANTRDQALEQSATSSAVRLSADSPSGSGRQSGSYTLHAMPWETGDYQSKRAINLYETNQGLPTSVGETIDMLPRVNERI